MEDGARSCNSENIFKFSGGEISCGESHHGRKKVVMKFGGSSLKNADRISSVAALVKTATESNAIEPYIILSAMGSTTSALIEAESKAVQNALSPHGSPRCEVDALIAHHTKIAEELGIFLTIADELGNLYDEMRNLEKGIRLLGETTKRANNIMKSFGERLSVRIFAAYMTEIQGVKAYAVDAPDAGLVIAAENTSPRRSFRFDVQVLPESYDNIAKYFDTGNRNRGVPIITGYIAKDANGAMATLGRNGSDFTASVVGAAVSAQLIEIWTDVDGVMTADPRSVKNAKRIDVMLFDEASEMATCGAQVLHPLTMRPAMASGIPISVKNSYFPNASGTLIVPELPKSHFARPVLTAIASKTNVTTVDMITERMAGAFGFLSTAFAVFDELSLSINAISTGEVCVSVTLDGLLSETDAGQVKRTVENRTGAEVVIYNNRGIVSLIGDPARTSEILSKSCTCFHENDIRVWFVSSCSSKGSATICLSSDDICRAVQTLHNSFF